jgi:hypothetical protein
VQEAILLVASTLAAGRGLPVASNAIALAVEITHETEIKFWEIPLLKKSLPKLRKCGENSRSKAKSRKAVYGSD